MSISSFPFMKQKGGMDGRVEGKNEGLPFFSVQASLNISRQGTGDGATFPASRRMGCLVAE